MVLASSVIGAKSGFPFNTAAPKRLPRERGKGWPFTRVCIHQRQLTEISKGSPPLYPCRIRERVRMLASVPGILAALHPTPAQRGIVHLHAPSRCIQPVLEPGPQRGFAVVVVQSGNPDCTRDRPPENPRLLLHSYLLLPALLSTRFRTSGAGAEAWGHKREAADI